MQTGGTTYYYVTNLQGDVVALLDASGSTVASYAYDPYGKILSSEGTMAETNPLRYRGYYYDAETGLYYLQSRYVPLRNTMTQMTDGGPRDRRYYIESLAKKYSLDTENTCSRSTGVRYTASTPTSEINSKKYALGIAKVEKGKMLLRLHSQMRQKYVSLLLRLILPELTHLLVYQ